MTSSLLIGFALGWAGSMPIAGAVSFFVCRRGLDARSGHGLALAGGAALAEAGWCLAILMGADELMDLWPGLATVARSLGGALLIVLGLVFLIRRNAPTRHRSGATVPQPRLRDEFRLGLTLVATNPAIPFNWLALITIAISFGLDPGRSPILFALGVGLGVIAWFAVLLRLISTWRERLHVGMLVWVQRGIAVLLIAAGLVAVWRAWL
jgi:threonine/homoserine/homoserine lactone efflux protein